MTIEQLFSSRKAFSDFVYTPWEEALRIIDERSADAKLAQYVDTLIPAGIPPIMQGKKSMVLFRHIATPNYEMNRFFIAADALQEHLQPLILEYTADKFNNRSDMKYFLGKLPFYKGVSGKGDTLLEYQTIIDFNKSNNQPIHEVTTSWGQTLVDFHHELFANAFPHLTHTAYDLSSWLHEVGPSAREYYKSFLALFLKDGILFENFYIDEKDKEYVFNRDVIFPAFLELYEETGVKPLIVALEPTHMEQDTFWSAHPFERKKHIDSKRETPS